MEAKFLEDLGVEKEKLDKILSENAKDIEEQKKLTSSVTTERDRLKTQLNTAIESPKISGSVDVDNLKKENKRLSGELASNKAEYETRITKLEQRAETLAFVNSLERKFVNEETKGHYVNKFEELKADEKSKGAAEQELWDSLIKNEKGEMKANIFAAPEPNVNQLVIPSVEESNLSTNIMAEQIRAGLGIK